MSDQRELCPERLLWAVVAAFESAVEADQPDPAARMLLGFGGLLVAAEDFAIGEQPDVAAAMARAIATVAPLLAELSALEPPVVHSATRGAAALAIAFGQTRLEVEALTKCGLLDELVDHAGAARAGLETAWRARRIAERNAAGGGSAALEPSGKSLH